MSTVWDKRHYSNFNMMNFTVKCFQRKEPEENVSQKLTNTSDLS